MAQITKITAQKRRGRYNIFLADQYAFAVSEHTLIQFNLHKGQELTATEIAAIEEAEVTATAVNAALNYLDVKPRTTKEVRTHLARHEVPPAVVAQAITRLNALHLLDDAAYAGMFTRDYVNLNHKGPAVIAQKLRQKGVIQAVIDDALAAIDSDQWQAAATQAATRIARQNTRRAYKEQLQKLHIGLRQAGFTDAVSAQAIADLQLSQDIDQEAERLEQEAAKQWRQKKRYTGYDRRQRVKQALFRKGFELEMIDAALDALEEAEA